MNKKIYHTVAFDLDGTLTNPTRGLCSAFRYALRKMGVEYGTDESLKRYIGPPLRDIWERDFFFTREESWRAVMLFREYFGVYGWWDNELYEGIPELLSDIKAAGKKIVLATSKPDVYSSKILKLFNIDGYFDFSEGASFDNSREKKWQVLEYALDSVGIKAEEREGCVLVGDTGFDAEGAALCGVDCIGVTYGIGTVDELLKYGCKHIAKNVEQVRKIIFD